MSQEFLSLHFANQGLIPVLKASLDFQQYQELGDWQWTQHENLAQKLQKLEQQINALLKFGLSEADDNFRTKELNIITLDDFVYPAHNLVAWPTSSFPNPTISTSLSTTVASSVMLDSSTSRVTRRVAKISEIDDKDSVAHKRLKTMQKSLGTEDIYNWDIRLKPSHPSSRRFIPKMSMPDSILKKNEGYTEQSKQIFDEEAQATFSAFEKDEQKPLYDDGAWKGCTYLKDKYYINSQLHHQLKIASKLDVDTKPVLHSDFTTLQAKCKQITIPNFATLLTYGKMTCNLGSLWELLNHSNQLNEHFFALINPGTLTEHQQTTFMQLREGDKVNRFCSTALLADCLELFDAKDVKHNMGKNDYTRWATSYLLKYNLWGAKKPDRIRDRKNLPISFEDLPEPLQKLWTKYNKLYVEKKHSITGQAMPGKAPKFEKERKHNNNYQPYPNGGNGNNSRRNRNNRNRAPQGRNRNQQNRYQSGRVSNYKGKNFDPNFKRNNNNNSQRDNNPRNRDSYPSRPTNRDNRQRDYRPTNSAPRPQNPPTKDNYNNNNKSNNHARQDRRGYQR
tara:strand:+ start:47 stop:1735 length:1689 start_codon:yes stop_codon:yes gene_type:complete